MSIIARYSGRCPQCHKPITAGVDRIEKIGRGPYMHSACRQKEIDRRIAKTPVIIMPPARRADAPSKSYDGLNRRSRKGTHLPRTS
jgi:hypothetical protein